MTQAPRAMIEIDAEDLAAVMPLNVAMTNEEIRDALGMLISEAKQFGQALTKHKKSGMLTYFRPCNRPGLWTRVAGPKLPQSRKKVRGDIVRVKVGGSASRHTGTEGLHAMTVSLPALPIFRIDAAEGRVDG